MLWWKRSRIRLLTTRVINYHYKTGCERAGREGYWFPLGIQGRASPEQPPTYTCTKGHFGVFSGKKSLGMIQEQEEDNSVRVE